jgi:hypothetical protein
MDSTNSNDSNSIHSLDSSDMITSHDSLLSPPPPPRNNKRCFVLITSREPNRSYIRKNAKIWSLDEIPIPPLCNHHQHDDEQQEEGEEQQEDDNIINGEEQEPRLSATLPSSVHASTKDGGEELVVKPAAAVAAEEEDDRTKTTSNSKLPSFKRHAIERQSSAASKRNSLVARSA